MSDRISVFTVEGPVLDLFISDCATCGVLFGIPSTLEKRRRSDKQAFYCPNGHNLVFTGDSDAEKLRKAQARETALRDQMAAAVREAEAARVALLRDRQRFANGVCPCCNRSFENVRRHMVSKHPDYDVTKVKAEATTRFRCECGRAFKSLRGLRVHQGHWRNDGWESSKSAWGRHLTKV